MFYNHYVAQLVKNPPAMQQTWVWFLGWEDPLEKGKATYSSILAWRIPGTKSMGSQRVGHNWATFTSLQCTSMKTQGWGRESQAEQVTCTTRCQAPKMCFDDVVQLLSSIQIFEIPWIATCQTPLSFTISWSLLKFMSNELVMPFNHLILGCSLLLLPSIFASIRVFSNEWALSIRWPKYWSFSFSNSPSIEYSGLISFRMDWLDLLAVQGTL